MYCKKCGNEIKEGMKFCENCGTPVVEQNNNSEISTKQKKRISKKIVIALVTAAVVIAALIVLLVNLFSPKYDLTSMYDIEITGGSGYASASCYKKEAEFAKFEKEIKAKYPKVLFGYELNGDNQYKYKDSWTGELKEGYVEFSDLVDVGDPIPSENIKNGTVVKVVIKVNEEVCMKYGIKGLKGGTIEKKAEGLKKVNNSLDVFDGVELKLEDDNTENLDPYLSPSVVYNGKISDVNKNSFEVTAKGDGKYLVTYVGESSIVPKPKKTEKIFTLDVDKKYLMLPNQLNSNYINEAKKKTKAAIKEKIHEMKESWFNDAKVSLGKYQGYILLSNLTYDDATYAADDINELIIVYSVKVDGTKGCCEVAFGNDPLVEDSKNAIVIGKNNYIKPGKGYCGMDFATMDPDPIQEIVDKYKEQSDFENCYFSKELEKYSN